MRFQQFVLVAAFAGHCIAQDRQPASKVDWRTTVTLQLSLSKQRFVLGEPIVVRMVISNNTKDPISGVPLRFGFSGELTNMSTKRTEGIVVPDRWTSGTKCTPANPKLLATLQPGDSLSYSGFIAESTETIQGSPTFVLRMPDPGDYKLKRLVREMIVNPKAPAADQVSFKTINQSDEVEFKIIEPSEEDKKVLQKLLGLLQPEFLYAKARPRFEGFPRPLADRVFSDRPVLEGLLKDSPNSAYIKMIKFRLATILIQASLKGTVRETEIANRQDFERGVALLKELSADENDDVFAPQALGMLGLIGGRVGLPGDDPKGEGSLKKLVEKFPHTDYFLGEWSDLK